MYLQDMGEVANTVAKTKTLGQENSNPNNEGDYQAVW
jgi:hypothetical protein